MAFKLARCVFVDGRIVTPSVNASPTPCSGNFRETADGKHEKDRKKTAKSEKMLLSHGGGVVKINKAASASARKISQHKGASSATDTATGSCVRA